MLKASTQLCKRLLPVTKSMRGSGSTTSTKVVDPVSVASNVNVFHLTRASQHAWDSKEASLIIVDATLTAPSMADMCASEHCLFSLLARDQAQADKLKMYHTQFVEVHVALGDLAVENLVNSMFIKQKMLHAGF